MKIQIVCLFMAALSAWGQTTNDFYAVLHCADGDYYNATVESVTPATVLLSWEGGGGTMALTNLPVPLQKKYHYDADAAREYLERQAAKISTSRQRFAAQAAAINAAKGNLGPAMSVLVNKVIAGNEVEIVAGGTNSKASIHGLPAEVIEFVEDYNKSVAMVREMSNLNENETYTFGGSGKAAGSLTDSAASVKWWRAHLAEIQPDAVRRATVTARPSQFVVGGVYRQWEYQPGPPPEETRAVARAGTHASGQLPMVSRVGGSLRDGVPADVYSGIKATAEDKWPGNFEMQVYEIKNQVTAYRQLHGQ